MQMPARSPTVVVIINPVLIPIGCSGPWTVHLLLVHPQIAGQVRVLPVHPSIYDAHSHLQAYTGPSSHAVRRMPLQQRPHICSGVQKLAYPVDMKNQHALLLCSRIACFGDAFTASPSVIARPACNASYSFPRHWIQGAPARCPSDLPSRRLVL